MNRQVNKVAIVGVGEVGATCAYALAISGTASEIALIDIDRERARGEAMDLNHGLSFIRPCRIWAGDYQDCERADVVIITAGAAQKPGESRLDLVERNDAIFRSLIPNITAYNQDGILLVVSNPVDVLTYRAWQYSGFAPKQVLGTGTSLDTARFRHLLGEHFDIDPRNVHAYIVGEHGDTELALWSSARIAGMPIHDFCRLCNHEYDSGHLEAIFQQVKSSAHQIIKRKGATNHAIGLALVAIVEAILRNQRTIIPVSRLIEGQHGVKDVCLSLPAILGRNQAQTLEPIMSSEEKEAFRHSAHTLREVIDSLSPV